MRIRILAASAILVAATIANAAPQLERVTTLVPFPRGVAFVGDDMYVLARGRVRGSGGVSAEVNDRAGTIYKVDPNVSEPWSVDPAGDAVRTNGVVFAEPTDPPFLLWDRTSNPPEADRMTDRPYCTLRYHEPTHSLYICGFSGVDLKRTDTYPVAFSKNLSDAILRYDLRTEAWYDVERHDARAGGNYPQSDPNHTPAPHGWLNGPDNILALGDQLYAVAKDNSLLVRYELGPLSEDPDAPPPEGYPVLEREIVTSNAGTLELSGHSALAYNDGWLYLGTRSNSLIVRFPLDDAFMPIEPIRGELLARFDPYNPATGKSANITDMDFDADGRLYVVSASPARIFRFLPDPQKLFDARAHAEAPWADLAAITENPKMKSENVTIHGEWAYVTSGDGYSYQAGADGTLYRLPIGP